MVIARSYGIGRIEENEFALEPNKELDTVPLGLSERIQLSVAD